MRLQIAIGGLAAVGVLAGCGGTAPTLGGGGIDRNYGPVITRAVGGVQEPVSASTSYAGVSGVFGANFIGASVNLPPETMLNEEAILGTTMLAYSVNGRPMLHEYGTGMQYHLNPQVPVFANVCSPTFSGTGDQICTTEYDQPTGQFQLFTYNSDGSGRTRITSGAGWCVNPSWSPVSTKIAFGINGDIWSINRDGSGLTQLTATAESETLPRFSPSGAKIYYVKNSGGIRQVWEMNTNGTGQIATAVNLGSSPVYGMDLDPSGTEVALVTYSAPNYTISRRTLATGQTSYLLFSTPDEINGVTWSPTGSHIAYARDGASPRIETVRIRDGSTQTLRSISSTFAEGTPEWGPVVRKRSLIAASGVLGTNAAGFMYGMAYSNFASFLAFDAVTRNTVDIDMPPPSGISAANLFATISAADSINMLRYVNGMNVPRVTIVDPAQPATHVQGALVAFDGYTGKVANVIPFNRSRSGEKPARVDANGTVTFRGEFVGVFDGEGKKTNEGASELVFDARTGALQSAR